MSKILINKTFEDRKKVDRKTNILCILTRTKIFREKKYLLWLKRQVGRIEEENAIFAQRGGEDWGYGSCILWPPKIW